MRGAVLVVLLLLPAPAPAQLISVGPSAGHRAALTFDAGADRGYAATILTVLERNHVHATFGMTGLWARTNPDLVRRMARDGDTFINHTYNHRSFTGLSDKLGGLTAAQRRWEITQTESIIYALTRRTTKPYFRPPYGDYDAATLTEVRQLGYRYAIMWTVDSGGWLRLPSATILQRCVLGARPGAIFLMHVGIQSQDAFALQPLITNLRSRHYQLVTVPQLLGHA